MYKNHAGISIVLHRNLVNLRLQNFNTPYSSGKKTSTPRLPPFGNNQLLPYWQGRGSKCGVDTAYISCDMLNLSSIKKLPLIPQIVWSVITLPILSYFPSTTPSPICYSSLTILAILLFLTILHLPPQPILAHIELFSIRTSYNHPPPPLSAIPQLSAPHHSLTTPPPFSAIPLHTILAILYTTPSPFSAILHR